MRNAHLQTRAVHAGRDDLVALGVHATPLDLSTTYPSRDSRREAQRLDVWATGEVAEGQPIYGRLANPTVTRFETALAELEGCESAVAFASGMAALSACLLACAAAGQRHVVALRPLYGTSDFLLESGLLGTQVTWADPDSVTAAIRDDTGMVIAETPANPTLEQVDIAALARACGDTPLLIDNTFATPILQRPADHGAALVLHSATKFLGGHGDVMGGIVACDEAWARRLRQIRFATGAMLHPLAGYLLLRGLSTLAVRMRESSATAWILANQLADHPRVTRMHYPCGNEQGHNPQMRSGGALITIEIDGDPHAVINAVQVFTPAVSLGSVDSLIQHPGSLSHHIIEPETREQIGISENSLRLSIGLEHHDDLWSDLDQALRSTT